MTLSIRHAVFVGLLASFAAGCNEQKAARVEPPRPVMAQTVAYGPVQPARSFAGTIRPRVETDQGFRVAGKVARRLVDVGEQVKQGQPLATLDDTDLRLQSEQARAERDAAESALTQAAAEEKRQQSLRDNGWSTAAAIEKARATADEARGRLTRAVRALELADNSRAYATLAADYDGVVTGTGVEPGQVVTAGQMAIRIARTDSLEAVVSIPESLVDVVRRDDARVTLWSEPGRSLPARLREFSPIADAATRTYQARFTLSERPADVKLGMTATVTLAEPAAGNVARLPLSALFSQDNRSSVWVVGADGHLTLKPVDVVSYDSNDVLIRSGVAEGDRVVTLGVQKLDAGQTVRVIDNGRG